MSVENKKPKINIDKMADWLQERTTTLECPFCKGTAWEAVNGASYVGNALPYGSGGGDMYMVGFPVLSLVCAKCNFVRNVALTKEILDEVMEEEYRAEE